MDREATARAPSPVRLQSRRAAERLTGLYVVGLGAGAFVLGCGLVYVQTSVPELLPHVPFSWPGFVLLVCLAILAEKYTIHVGEGIEISAGFLAYFVSGAIFGPLASFVTAIVGQIPLMGRHSLLKNLCFAATLAIVTGGTSLVYCSLANKLAYDDSGGYSLLFMASIGLGAGLFFQTLNYLLVLPVARLRGGIDAKALWKVGVKPVLPFHLFFLAISLGLILVYQNYVNYTAGQAASSYSSLLLLLFLLPTIGLIYAFRAYAGQLDLARANGALAARNERLAMRNEKLALQSIASQITALDLKDNYTAAHSAAVSQWATDIAREMKLTKREVNLAQFASLLHDVGKIGVPDEILNSPMTLDRVAWAMVEGHCVNGYKILKSIDQFRELATVVLYHHERYDGTGYPEGLAGEEIPLLSRIICVADSYSAMVSDRPYRARMDPEAAMEELINNRGTQFDPAIVDCFLTILQRNDEHYQKGEGFDFLVEFQRVKFLRDLSDEPDKAATDIEALQE